MTNGGLFTMKKIIAIILAAIFTLSMTACSKQEEQSDLDYVMNKGVLVVGVTEFEPMDYLDENGEWIGFDADLAKAFAESLGLKAEFVKIDWSKKTMELSGKTVDCIWNGMTLNDEVLASMECSKAYCSNAQIVILPKEKENLSMDDLKNLSFAVENGSAGQAAAETNGFKFTPVLTQADAVMEVASGTSDAAIIDSLMAAAMVGEGTGYPDLTYTISLTAEEYGVGFRKGSKLAEKLNEFFADSYADGSLLSTAEKYGVQAAVLEQ